MKHLYSFILLLLFFPSLIDAQTSNYSFAPSAGTFTPITGTIVAPANSDLDEGFYNNIPIGFTFRFFNADYTTVSASTNGWMTFGQAIVNPFLANNLEAGGMRPLVAPWWDDLAMATVNDFSYNTTGIAPNRIFTAQWMNAKWDWNATSAVISFQVKLYETTGKIEFIYSQVDGIVNNFSGGASIGVAGPLTGPNNYVSLLSADPAATASSTVDTKSIGDRPLTDQVFTFTPGTVSTSSPSQVTAGNIILGAANNIISTFQVSASGSDAVLNNLSFTTSGTSTGSDISNLKLFYSTSPSFPGGSPLLTISSYTGSGTYAFNGLNHVCSGTGYFWITCDVSSTATLGRTINIGANPSLTFVQGVPSGTIAAGGIQTISAAPLSISSPNPAVPAGNIVLNTFDNIIYRLDMSATLASITVTGLRITNAGTFTSGDLSGMKLYYSTDANLSPINDMPLGKKTSVTGPGPQTFSFTQVIPANSTGYFFVTCDVLCAAVGGHTINVNAVTSADVTVSSGTVTGNGFQGGVLTFQNVTPANVGAPSAAPDLTGAVLTWTPPATCYDQVMIVAKAGSSITGVPSGDGSAYSANLVYGNGTAFDGGFVVYSGVSSPQTVTALVAGSSYYFKFFSRKGSSWSPGVEVSTTIAPPSNGEYRSATTGDWGAVTTWQLYNNGTWTTPTWQQGIPSEQSGKITIRNGHTVTMRANTTADQVTIDAGGVLNIINNRTLTISNGPDAFDLIVNGSVVNIGTITANGAIAFNNGATYEHQQNDGIIPAATWNTGSTCLVTGTTNTVPRAGLNQSFYNFTWNCTGQGKSPLSLNGNPAIVSGTFRLSSTGSGQNAGSLTLGGNATYNNFIIAGGTFILTGGQAWTLNTTTFTIQGGTLNMSDAGIGTMNVSGNFTGTGGTITETGTGSGNIVFNGTFNGTTGVQTFTSGLLVTNTVNFTVNPNAFLQMAAEGTVVTGGGTFTLSSGATLGITSVNGIAASGTASGNIQTTGRAFNTGANYIYNLPGGAQFSGSGLPVTAITGKVTIPANVILTSTNPIIMNGTLTVDGTLLPGQEYHVFSGTGTLTGTGRIKVTRTSATPEFLTQYTIANKQIRNATIDYYAAAGGQIVSPFTYGNLTMSNTSGTNTLGGAVNVSGTLTITAGGTLLIPASAFLTSTNVTNNGIFTIAGQGKATIGTLTNPGTVNLNSSSASSIYSLILLDNYSGQGIVNMQLFVTGGTVGGDKWHYVAVPASGLPSSLFSDMSDDFMAYDDARVTTSEFNGWSYYDGWDGMPGIPAGGGFQTLLFGKGYNFYYDYDATVNFTGLTSIGTNLGYVNLKYSGPTSGLAIFGLNLLGNSLTCSLDWDKVTFNGPVNQAVYYTKDNKWATYMKGAGGLNGATNYIPPLQGFMVKATGTGASIDLSSARTHSSQAWYKKSAGSSDDLQTEDKPSMRIKLALNGASSSDETIVWGNDQATADFDVNYDAVKLFSANVEDGQVYSAMGGINYAINGINIPADSATIPLAVKIVQEGSYSFIRKDIVVPDGFEVYLQDKDKNSVVKLNSTDTYEFTSVAGTISNRFLLKFKAPAENISTGIDNPGVTEKDFSVYASKGYVNILPLSNVINGQKGKVTLYDLSGRAVKQLSNVVWYEGGLIQIPAAYNGIMIVDFTSGARRFVEKIMTK